MTALEKFHKLETEKIFVDWPMNAPAMIRHLPMQEAREGMRRAMAIVEFPDEGLSGELRALRRAMLSGLAKADAAFLEAGRTALKIRESKTEAEFWSWMAGEIVELSMQAVREAGL